MTERFLLYSLYIQYKQENFKIKLAIRDITKIRRQIKIAKHTKDGTTEKLGRGILRL